MKVVTGFLPTPEGLAAFDRAALEAERAGGELILVGHAGNAPLPSDGQPEGFVTDAEARAASMEEALRPLREHGIACSAHLPAAPRTPAAALLEVAAEVDADLIVIGIRRRSRVGKLVLGSNAQSILLQAHCPVLSVKSKDDL